MIETNFKLPLKFPTSNGEVLTLETSVDGFVVKCAHMESLHSHDAVSRICKGLPNGLR